MKNIRIDNKRILIVGIAQCFNNFVDCDVIQEGINELEKAESTADIIASAKDLRGYIAFRRNDKSTLDAIDEIIIEIEQLQ